MPTRFRWADISPDPNAAVVLRQRDEQLRSSRRPPVPLRSPYLCDLARGRNVLDVGVVEHMVSNEESPHWLHRKLVNAADRCVGVDILEDGVAALVERGYDVRVHDLTTSPLDEQFDLIVAGEIIEHLGAPQPFLDNIRPMLAPGGRFVMTTVNPYVIGRAWKYLRGLEPDSADHTIVLGPANVLELASRAGLVLDTWRGVRLKDLAGARNRVLQTGRKALSSTVFTPESMCESLIYELVVADA